MIVKIFGDICIFFDNDRAWSKENCKGEKMNYKIKGAVGLSNVPMDTLAKIIKNAQDSIVSVIKARFPKESKEFKIFIQNFTHESLGWDMISNKPDMLKAGVDFIDESIRGNISQLPIASYQAFENLREIAIDIGDSFAVYHGNADVPLFELNAEKGLPARFLPVPLIEEEMTTLGRILEFKGVGQNVTIHIRLLDNQDISLKVPRNKAIELRKWLYEYVKVFGTVTREEGSWEFKNFDVRRIKFEVNGERIRQALESTKGYDDEEEGESADLEALEREFLAV